MTLCVNVSDAFPLPLVSVLRLWSVDCCLIARSING